MTRDYNNQRRDNVRPFSRNHPSGRPGDERFQHSPRSARPRLNRDTVDRAWESGAPPKHADYRTRTSNGQPPRNNWRNNQQSERSSAQNGRKSFGSRPDNNQRFDRTSNGNSGTSGPRSRSFDTDRRTSGNQHSYERRGYANGPNRNDARPGFRDNSQSYGQRSQYRDRTYSRNSYQSDSERTDRQPRKFGHNDRSPRNDERSSRRPYGAQAEHTGNPRWQSRPNNSFRREPTFNERRVQTEQERFEGDYERFDKSAQQHPGPARPFQDRSERRNFRSEPEERHVTRLPDGRVLKGPRPVQRRNAQFWTDVASETENLIQQVEADPPDNDEQSKQQPAEIPQAKVQDMPSQKPGKRDKPKTPPRPRTRVASAVARGKKAGGKQASEKPRSTGPKPSQRGFKWPKP